MTTAISLLLWPRSRHTWPDKHPRLPPIHPHRPRLCIHQCRTEMRIRRTEIRTAGACRSYGTRPRPRTGVRKDQYMERIPSVEWARARGVIGVSAFLDRRVCFDTWYVSPFYMARLMKEAARTQSLLSAGLIEPAQARGLRNADHVPPWMSSALPSCAAAAMICILT